MEIKDIIKKCKEKRKSHRQRKEVLNALYGIVNENDSPYYSIEFLKKAILKF